jgi:hypothetical protein
MTTERDDVKLKRCPFCNAEMEQHDKYPNEYRHALTGRRCLIGGMIIYLTDAEAVAAWNRRSPVSRKVKVTSWALYKGGELWTWYDTKEKALEYADDGEHVVEMTGEYEED